PVVAARGFARAANSAYNKKFQALLRSWTGRSVNGRTPGSGPGYRGSNPCLPANYPVLPQELTRSLRRRCPTRPTRLRWLPIVEQSNRRTERRWRQVRVPLGHRQTLVSDQLLHAPHRRALHRQMRAERVTQDVNAG